MGSNGYDRSETSFIHFTESVFIASSVVILGLFGMYVKKSAEELSAVLGLYV